MCYYRYLIVVLSLFSLGTPLWSATAEAHADYQGTASSTHQLNLSMWYPDDAPVLRGAIVHSHGIMPVSDATARAEFQRRAEWQHLAREHGMAIIGLRWTGGDPNGDVSAGNDPFRTPIAVKNGLDQLAVNARRPELTTAPLAFLGFSAGGGFALRAAKHMSNRCFAAVHLKGRSIGYVTDVPISVDVPAFICFGTLDDDPRCTSIRDAFRTHRASYGEPWMLLPDRNLGHTEPGDGISFAMYFIDRMATRLVRGGGTVAGVAPALSPLKSESFCLGSNSDGGTWQTTFQDAMPTITGTTTFGTDPGTSWLPGKDFSTVWQSVAANHRWGKMDLHFTTAMVGKPTTVTLTKGDEPATALAWYIESTKMADGDGTMTSFDFTPDHAGVFPVHVRSTVAGVTRSVGLTVVVAGASGGPPAWKSRP